MAGYGNFYAPGQGTIVQPVTVSGQAGSTFGGPSDQGQVAYWEAWNIGSGGTGSPAFPMTIGGSGLPFADAIFNDRLYVPDDGFTAATYNFNLSMTFYPGMSTQQLISVGLEGIDDG